MDKETIEVIYSPEFLAKGAERDRILRDQFAMACLPALISEDIGDEKYSVEVAYAYADAMLKARSK